MVSVTEINDDKENVGPCPTKTGSDHSTSGPLQPHRGGPQLESSSSDPLLLSLPAPERPLLERLPPVTILSDGSSTNRAVPILRWLERFEWRMEVSQTPQDLWAIKLQDYTTGRAKEFMEQLRQLLVFDYALVRELMLTRFSARHTTNDILYGRLRSWEEVTEFFNDQVQRVRQLYPPQAANKRHGLLTALLMARLPLDFEPCYEALQRQPSHQAMRATIQIQGMRIGYRTNRLMPPAYLHSGYLQWGFSPCLSFSEERDSLDDNPGYSCFFCRAGNHDVWSCKLWNEFEDLLTARTIISRQNPRRRTRRLKVCYICGSIEHLKRRCPLFRDVIRSKWERERKQAEERDDEPGPSKATACESTTGEGSPPVPGIVDHDEPPFPVPPVPEDNSAEARGPFTLVPLTWHIR
jgi:hypothetical protein